MVLNIVVKYSKLVILSVLQYWTTSYYVKVYLILVKLINTEIL